MGLARAPRRVLQLTLYQGRKGTHGGFVFRPVDLGRLYEWLVPTS